MPDGASSLCVALGAVFCFDLFMYAEAMLYSRLNTDIWAARGSNTMGIPLPPSPRATPAGPSTRRVSPSGPDLHGTDAPGLFLLAVSVAAYFVRLPVATGAGPAGRADLCVLLFATLLCPGRFQVLLASIHKQAFLLVSLRL
jgi:hypothetical protein